MKSHWITKVLEKNTGPWPVWFVYNHMLVWFYNYMLIWFYQQYFFLVKWVIEGTSEWIGNKHLWHNFSSSFPDLSGISASAESSQAVQLLSATTLHTTTCSKPSKPVCQCQLKLANYQPAQLLVVFSGKVDRGWIGWNCVCVNWIALLVFLFWPNE